MPALRAERKRISREVAGLDRNEVPGLAQHLIESGVVRFVAYELVLNHKATMESINRSDVVKLGSIGGADCFVLVDPSYIEPRRDYGGHSE